MNRAPTFEELREKRKLDVIYPETGARFRVSLRDWEGCLWAIRVYPHTPSSCDKDNPYVTAHRMMSRDAIE